MTLDEDVQQTLEELGVEWGYDAQGFWVGDQEGGRYTDPAPTAEQVERAAHVVSDEDVYRDSAHRFEVFHDALGLSPGRFDEGWRVEADEGGIWYPDEEAQEEILAAPDPALHAVLICVDEPRRGTWHA